MAEFVYNNAKNINFSYTPLELNCGYHFQMLYKKDVNPRFKFQSANEILAELRELMIVCRENFYYAQEF